MKAYNSYTKIATVLSYRFAKIRHEDSEVTGLTKKYLRKPLKKAANKSHQGLTDARRETSAASGSLVLYQLVPCCRSQESRMCAPRLPPVTLDRFVRASHLQRPEVSSRTTDSKHSAWNMYPQVPYFQTSRTAKFGFCLCPTYSKPFVLEPY